jgi:hypothetical protein
MLLQLGKSNYSFNDRQVALFNENKVFMLPPNHCTDTDDITTGFVLSWILLGVLGIMYLSLITYLTFVMFGMSRYALALVVLIGSFFAPILVPALFVILLACGAIHETIETVIA